MSIFSADALIAVKLRGPLRPRRPPTTGSSRDRIP
jgi:hypothetical protein